MKGAFPPKPKAATNVRSRFFVKFVVIIFDKRMSKTRRVKFFRANEGVFSAEKGGEVEIFINFVGV